MDLISKALDRAKDEKGTPVRQWVMPQGSTARSPEQTFGGTTDDIRVVSPNSEWMAESHLLTTPATDNQILADHFPIVPHAVNLSLGSADGIDDEYLEKLADLVDRLDPPWWSEHIAFTRGGAVDIGHLSPLPSTRDSIDMICHNIRRVRQSIAAPLILENITYTVTFPFSEMDEVTFLREVLEAADCGLLLDVTNLFTNATNHGYDPLTFFERLPLERIVQLHFAEPGTTGIPTSRARDRASDLSPRRRMLSTVGPMN